MKKSDTKRECSLPDVRRFWLAATEHISQSVFLVQHIKKRRTWKNYTKISWWYNDANLMGLCCVFFPVMTLMCEMGLGCWLLCQQLGFWYAEERFVSMPFTEARWCWADVTGTWFIHSPLPCCQMGKCGPGYPQGILAYRVSTSGGTAWN
jgi:hypothetical protein